VKPFLAFTLCILALGSTAFGKSQPGDELFNNPRLRTFKITIADDQYKALAKDNRKYVRATIVEGGITYSNVAVRLKGMGSFRPLHEKPGLAVKFDEYVPHQRFCGLSKLMLNNSAQDGSYLAEYAATSLFRDAGLPVARVTHGFVELNGKDLGLYVIIEAVNKDFLRRHFKNANGNLYEAYLQDIDQPLDLDNGIDIKQTDVKALVEACQIPDPAQRWSHLNRLMDVDGFITHTLIEMFTSHTDGYALNRNNYRLYHDPTTDRLVFITHGVDWGFGNTGVGIRPPMNSIVVKAVLGTPDGRKIYRERLGLLYTNVFKVDVLTNRVNEAVARLKAAARNPGEAKEFENYGAGMRNLIVARHQNVTQQISTPEPEPLKFDSTGYAGVGGWRTKIDSGNPQLERRTEGSHPILYINGDNGGCVASWRARVLLDGGKYRFEGRARGEHIASQASDIGAGAGLRISGGKRTNKVEGDAQWTQLDYDFELPPGGLEVEFVCELRASKGAVWFDRDSLHLKKL
jgi:spore coat protein H